MIRKLILWVVNHAVDWRGLFSASSDQTLRFYPLQNLDSKVFVTPPQEVIDEGAS